MDHVVAFTINIPASLRQKIMDSAKENSRSVDLEAIDRLELSYGENQNLRRKVLYLEEQIDDLKSQFDEKMEKLGEIFAALHIGNA